jgi:lambda repressor-like predicted transcriptional regulator
VHPAEIQALLKKRGIKQADIARECEVSRTIVGDVIQGRRRSKQVEQRISELTELTPPELWPQWYGSGTWWATQHEMLTRDEALLLRSYRALSMDLRAQILARVQAMEAGFDELQERETGRVKVAGNKNRVAGRDYHEGANKKK